MANKKIIEYVTSLIGYPIKQFVVERIIKERGLEDIDDWTDMTTRMRNLVVADLLFNLFTSPNDTGSKSKTHNNFTVSVGGTKLYDKNDIYSLMMTLYKNPDQELWEALDNIGGCQWLDVL